MVTFVRTVIAGLWTMLLSAAAMAAEPGTVKGQMTYDGAVYALRHVYAWQPPLQNQELWIFLTDRPVPPEAVEDAEALEQLVRDNRFGGIKLIIDPVRPQTDDARGAVYAPRDGGFSLDTFNFGPSWQALTVVDRRVSGKAETKWMNWTLAVEFSAPVEGSTGSVQTLEAAEAQRSPQAEAFIAFEKALLEQGIEAAGPFMTAAKLADMRGRVARLGEASFREFQAKRRATTAIGEARRRQIERIDIDGDVAEIGARNAPDSLDTALLIKTPDGWRVSAW